MRLWIKMYPRQDRQILYWPLTCLLYMALFTGSSSAQTVVQSPASQSPHWSHINLYDFGRALSYIADPTTKTAAYQWFTQHIDAAEVNGNTSDLLALNPTLKTSVYQLDLSSFTGPETASLPEAYFLHFSEDTQLKFVNLDGSQNAMVTITGCPTGTPITTACRVQVYIWTNRRYLYNLGDVGFQAWKAQQLLTSIGSRANEVFLDEHGPGLVLTASFGHQAVVMSGGGILEFNGQRPGTSGDAMDVAYNNTMVAWLGYLSNQFKQAGKRVVINAATYAVEPMVINQIMAANGVSTEGMHRPDSWAGAYQYQQFQDMVKSVVAAGGVVDLHGTWCYTGPSSYSNGNYASSEGRYRMWRLASYYLMKEPVGSAAMVYFNPAFCSNFSVQPLNDQAEATGLSGEYWSADRRCVRLSTRHSR